MTDDPQVVLRTANYICQRRYPGCVMFANNTMYNADNKLIAVCVNCARLPEQHGS